MLLVPMTTARTMASKPEVVEVFECEGSFSFLREEHRFTFRVHSDSSLHVDVKPLCAASQVDAIAIGQERVVRGTIEDIDDVEEEEEDQRTTEAIEEENAVQEGEEPEAEDGEEEQEEIPAKLLAYDGRALVEMPPEGDIDDTQPVCYVMHFKIVQWGRGAQGMWSQIVKCIAHLSSEYGMSGRFSEVGEDLIHAQDFALMPVSHRLESLHSPLHPLTPGRYELRGITIAENAFVYECAVNITLQENGMMSGTSRELPFTQECPLAGMWTRSGLNYLLQYEMHGNKHTYIYFGTPFRSGLQGTWQNSELRALENNLDARASQAERGILSSSYSRPFAFGARHITKTTRRHSGSASSSCCSRLIAMSSCPTTCGAPLYPTAGTTGSAATCRSR